jgi:hypothetical protein
MKIELESREEKLVMALKRKVITKVERRQNDRENLANCLLGLLSAR